MGAHKASNFFSIFLLVMSLGGFSICGFAAPIHLNKIQLPPGFKITLLTKQVPGAREMALGDNHVLFVGTRRAGKVYALQLTADDHHVNNVKVLYKNLQMPNGVAYRNGALYIAEVSRILRVDDIVSHLKHPPKPTVLYNKLPTNVHHGWKYIAFGPDGYLYIPIGAPCNVCIRDNPLFATITRMKPDGSQLQIFARGVRNSVGFDWDPITKALWFTDNGRDWLGDNHPPDELNKASKAGLHFGFPYFYGDNQPDPSFGKLAPPGDYQIPQQKLGPHVAALGMVFYTGKQFPKRYHNQIFIAEHGSWNRTHKIGYRITWVQLKNHQAAGYHVFAKGWLQGERAWGRPVALLQLPDGSLLVSDDNAGAIYRVYYSEAG
jgi:glucose/arabinose dehydrogenase